MKHNDLAAFHWQGSPSIFTTGHRAYEYGVVSVVKHANTSLRRKNSPTELPGGSVYGPPKMMNRGKK